MTKRDELIELNEAVIVGHARLADALENIMRAMREGKDVTLVVAAFHKYAATLMPVIERRNKLLRETDERLS